jgi:hypothetical protein
VCMLFEALLWPLFSNLVVGSVNVSFCEGGQMWTLMLNLILTVEFSCYFSESSLHRIYMSVCVFPLPYTYVCLDIICSMAFSLYCMPMSFSLCALHWA